MKGGGKFFRQLVLQIKGMGGETESGPAVRVPHGSVSLAKHIFVFTGEQVIIMYMLTWTLPHNRAGKRGEI